MDLEASNSTSNNNQPDPNPHLHSHFFTDDPESTCSTPYVSAPSSPGRSGPINGGFFYSCPASPMHFAISSTAVASSSAVSSPDNNNFGYEFEFSARFGSSGSCQPGSMISADELFLDGKIRPMKLSTHLERPQVLAPLMDLDEEDEDEVEADVAVVKRGRDLRGFRDKSLRRTRSMSPLRTTSFEFGVADGDEEDNNGKARTVKNAIKIESCDGTDDNETKNDELSTPSVSASSSRSSSAGRNSKRWVFLKDFLYRSKSEGRSNNKFWSNISFSPGKDKKPINSSINGGSNSNSNSNSQVNVTNAGMDHTQKEKVKGKKPVNGVGKRRVPASPHELHYKASRAQAEEMRKKTFLPYRQGLLGCLGFSSKSYGAMNGFARALNPVSSR